MNAASQGRHATLATRLVVLFTLGSAVLMSAIGVWLYHALRLQLEERDLAEIHGKTEIIEHLLAGIARPDELAANLRRFRDISLGHPHITVGLKQDGQWLLLPTEPVRAQLDMPKRSPGRLPDHVLVLTGADATWWVKRIPYRWPQKASPEVVVYLVVDVSESRQILREHGLAAIVGVLLGSIASGLLAFLVVRRGLAPIATIAAEAERMTTARLGALLDIEHAPEEIRRLVESLNRMLSRLGESFQSLEQFSADIAHELRTPLNNLKLRTEVTLSRPREAQEYQEALLGNLEELDRLQRMVSEMLFLARADRGMLALQQVPVDLRAEADSLAEFFELAASERGQHIQVSGHAQVAGDRLMLRRVLTNLLSNAVRHAPPQSEIGLTLTMAEHTACVRVSNPSAPLPPETMARLFTRFAHQNDARSRDTDSVGLGLAIVDSIVRLHGGTVTVTQGDGQIMFELAFPGRS